MKYMQWMQLNSREKKRERASDRERKKNSKRMRMIKNVVNEIFTIHLLLSPSPQSFPVLIALSFPHRKTHTLPFIIHTATASITIAYLQMTARCSRSRILYKRLFPYFFFSFSIFQYPFHFKVLCYG